MGGLRDEATLRPFIVTPCDGKPFVLSEGGQGVCGAAPVTFTLLYRLRSMWKTNWEQ